jgi:purine nucleoside permease
MSAQEENATLEVMVRAAIEGLVDFARIILIRAGKSFPFQQK